jgi:cyclopropane fatty-acyl-phospholipid synthase-like methyltransferase
MKFPFLDILSLPSIYNLFSRLLGGNCGREYVERYIQPKEGDKILDIGCGTGNILLYLPKVEYVGFDMSKAYIDFATRRFGDRGTFYCKKVTKEAIQERESVDIVLATGVIHHLNDGEALQLFELASSVLKPSGRLITIDNCYMERQSKVARYLISRDRGSYVRKNEDYLGIASRVFANVKMSIRHDLMRVPYTHIIMECAK